MKTEIIAQIKQAIGRVETIRPQTFRTHGHWHYEYLHDGVYLLNDEIRHYGSYEAAIRLSMRGWIPRLRKALREMGLSPKVTVVSQYGRIQEILIDGVSVFWHHVWYARPGISKCAIPRDWEYMEK